MSKKTTLLLRTGLFPERPNDREVSIGYLVEKVTNTVTYSPGQVLRRNEVERLCDNPAYEITIIGPERR